MTWKNDLAWIVRRRFLPKPARKNQLHHVAAGPVVVAGLFSTSNGIGKSARLHYEALRQTGNNPRAIDLSSFFGVNDHSPDMSFIDGVPDDEIGTLIVCLNPVEAEAALYSPLLRQAKDWRIIGNWVWELAQAPKRWTYLSRMYSEVWVPSKFVAQALKVNVPVKIVPLCVQFTEISDPSPLEHRQGLRFLIAADGWSSFERKNVLGSLRAYKSAFPEAFEHTLIVKCRNLQTQPEYSRQLSEEIGHRPDITVHSTTITDGEMQTLIETSDVIISLHRSEGYGLVLAEAMMSEKVVVATAWSGNLEFMNDQNSILIDCEFSPVCDPFGVYDGSGGSEWADPYVDKAAEALRIVAGSTEFRRDLSMHARKDAILSFDPEHVSNALKGGSPT